MCRVRNREFKHRPRACPLVRGGPTHAASAALGAGLGDRWAVVRQVDELTIRSAKLDASANLLFDNVTSVTPNISATSSFDNLTNTWSDGLPNNLIHAVPHALTHTLFSTLTNALLCGGVNDQGASLGACCGAGS
jgi:hypothetical protein